MEFADHAIRAATNGDLAGVREALNATDHTAHFRIACLRDVLSTATIHGLLEICEYVRNEVDAAHPRIVYRDMEPLSAFRLAIANVRVDVAQFIMSWDRAQPEDSRVCNDDWCTRALEQLSRGLDKNS